jgi:hypothetical protein
MTESDAGSPDDAPGIVPELVSLLDTVLTAVSALPIQFCLIGAVALGAWGRPRTTHDLDFLVLVKEEHYPKLIAALSSSDIKIDQRGLDANPMAKGRVTRFISSAHPRYPLDLIYVRDPQESAAVERRQTVALHGLLLPVVSPEDLILLKLKAGRPTDFDDVIGIVKNPRLQLDLAYLWSWADRLGLQGELHYVLQATATSG